MPTIQAARGLAPTARKRRPTVVLRNTIVRTTIRAVVTHTDTLKPRNRASPHSASSGGTRDSWGSDSRYHSVAPVVIAPTARVTINALSWSTATSKPLINPIAVAKNSAPASAITRAASWPRENPRMIVLERVMIAGIDRSMPREMITSASPMAVMARKAANGMMARNVEGRRLRGATIAEKTISPSIAIQIAAKRIWNGQPRLMGTDGGATVLAVRSPGPFIALSPFPSTDETLLQYSPTGAGRVANRNTGEPRRVSR